MVTIHVFFDKLRDERYLVWLAGNLLSSLIAVFAKGYSAIPS